MKRLLSSRRSVVASLAFAALAAIGTLGYIAPASAQSFSDPYLNPSIWNTPLKSSRATVALGWGSKGNWNYATGPDRTVFLTTTTADEEVDVYQRFGNYYKGKMFMPRNYTKPDYSGSNQIIVVQQPDGRVVEVQLVITYPEYVNGIKSVVGIVPQIGDNDTVNARQNIFGIGVKYGSHFGSGLPALGGTLRRGELSGSVAINHALNLLLPPEILNKSNGGFRWPATNADEGYQNSYLGGNTEARMGCLLALPSDFSTSGMTAEGARVANALKTYGGYCTDGAAASVFQIAMEESEYTHLKTKYTNTPDVSTTAWHADQIKILQNLRVVTNNGPDNIGGGYSAPYAGRYRIFNYHPQTRGRVLEVGSDRLASTNNGAAVNLWDWNGGNWQRWDLVDQGSGEWRVNGVSKGQSLTKYGGANGQAGNAGMWSWWGGNEQRWYFDSNGDGTYRIRNKGSNWCLSDNNYTDVSLWDNWYNYDEQRWVFERL